MFPDQTIHYFSNCLLYCVTNTILNVGSQNIAKNPCLCSCSSWDLCMTWFPLNSLKDNLPKDRKKRVMIEKSQGWLLQFFAWSNWWWKCQFLKCWRLEDAYCREEANASFYVLFLRSQLCMKVSDGSAVKSSNARLRSCRFNLWVRKNSWRRKWQSTPVFLPEKSHGPRSLVS